MSIDAMNEAIARSGGKWVKVRNAGDKIAGRLADYEERPKTWKDAPVLNSKTGKPRIEWVLTLEVDEADGPDDDRLRKVTANESMQRAISAAVRASGKPAEIGGHLAIAVKNEAASDTEQAEYVAAYKPPALAAAINDPAPTAEDDPLAGLLD